LFSFYGNCRDKIRALVGNNGKTHSMVWWENTSQPTRSKVEILPLGLMEVLLTRSGRKKRCDGS
jgi:hypothetical protein